MIRGRKYSIRSISKLKSSKMTIKDILNMDDDLEHLEQPMRFKYIRNNRSRKWFRAVIIEDLFRIFNEQVSREDLYYHRVKDVNQSEVYYNLYREIKAKDPYIYVGRTSIECIGETMRIGSRKSCMFGMSANNFLNVPKTIKSVSKKDIPYPFSDYKYTYDD